MLDRRQVIACLGLGGSGALAEPAPPAQIPPLSAATTGSGVAPGWRHQTLPTVDRSNQFAIVAVEGQRVLRIRSSASASPWVAPLDIDTARRPWLHWRWRVSHSLRGSDLRSRGGDDYAARLYVFFDLPAERLSLSDRMRIHATRLLSGADMPAAALCYVWGRAQAVGSSAWNPYTDRVRMVVVDSGDALAMHWRANARDVLRDWTEAFGGAVPRVSGVAVSADTDDTGDSVQAWFGDPRFAQSP